jgi:isoquinoline 1-oxidoreductase alpha subunit
MSITLTINGEARSVDVDPEMPLLWVLRDELNLTGTKFGCGVSLCGACTVHVDGMAIRSCQMPVGDLEGSAVTTIEAVATPEAEALRRAWTELDVPQCGYCQSGQIMQAAELLKDTPRPTDEDIDAVMDGNV